MDPMLSSLDTAAMLLQGQAISFVYLSGIFFVVAGLVVVMLGLHMVVLAKRLLSVRCRHLKVKPFTRWQEATILLRTSTICIAAALHLSSISRKTLAKHYRQLDIEFSSTIGDGLEAADGGDHVDNVVDDHADHTHHDGPLPTVTEVDNENQETPGNDDASEGLGDHRSVADASEDYDEENDEESGDDRG